MRLDNLDSTAAKTTTAAPEADEALEEEEEAESAAIFSPVISRALSEVDDSLLALAEAGLTALNPLRISLELFTGG